MEAELAELAVAEAETAERMETLEVERAALNVRLREIRSPVTGVVVNVHSAIGEFVENETKVLTVAETAELRVEAFAPIMMYKSLRTGMEMQVRLEEPFDTVFSAKISKIDKVSDTASGTFGIQLKLSNENSAILPGVRCKILVGS